jgi:hypothetical protein
MDRQIDDSWIGEWMVNDIDLQTNNKFFNCPELLFLKGMTGALAPYSYLVKNIYNNKMWVKTPSTVSVLALATMTLSNAPTPNARTY